MRKALNEPGFWLMIFGTIIIAMVLFAPDVRCESSDEMVVVSEDYGPITYTISFDNGLPVDEIKYYHLIGRTGDKPSLVGITDRMPTLGVLHSMLRTYLMAITGGI